MNEFQQLVHEFNQAVESPKSPSLRASLIDEEGKETIDALNTKDAIAFLDGLCDLLYVTYGAAATFDVEISTPHTSYDPHHTPLGWTFIEERRQALEGAVGKAVDRLLEFQEPDGLFELRIRLETLVNWCWTLASVGLGLDLRPFFLEVHRANMEKLTGPKREDGKQLKPEGWQPPRIAEMYAELGEREL